MIEWVSVNDQLPPPRERVLVYCKDDNEPAIAHLDRQGDWFYGYDDEVDEDVTHWARFNLP